MARRQALVIGLGQFGTALVRSLTASGMDVIAVDRRPAQVQAVAQVAAEALAFDAIDEEALGRTHPDERDVCVVAIGDDSREGAILVTALLRKLGARRVVARATDDLLERILYLVGAHEVVNPERAFGERLATRLLHEGVIDLIPLGDGLVITEVRTPRAFVGRRLDQLELPRRYGVTVLGIRRLGSDGRAHLQRPEASSELRDGDQVLIVAASTSVESLLERLDR